MEGSTPLDGLTEEGFLVRVDIWYEMVEGVVGWQSERIEMTIREQMS